MKVKFVGDPMRPDEQKNLPDTTTAYGVVFERGKFVEVPDKVAPKFEGNSHFETQGPEPDKK